MNSSNRNNVTRARSVGALLLAGALVAGCGGRSSSPPAKSAQTIAPITAAEKAEVVEAREQRDAQRSWCNYLSALYLRAAEGAKAWPRYEQCIEVTTTASPKMLKRTAECSLTALQQFKGDPFTAEYAAQVSRCGADAIEAMVVTQSELAPFVATICGRMSTCGNVGYAECREGLEEGLGPHLERAIGAINTRGRAQLRACLKGAACDELGAQITSCLEPLMEGLLWLPG